MTEVSLTELVRSLMIRERLHEEFKRLEDLEDLENN